MSLEFPISPEDPWTLIRKTVKLKPDVVIMDLMMPKKDGAAATAEILAVRPETKVLLLTTFGTSDGIANTLNAGAAGALMKSTPNLELVASGITVESLVAKGFSDNKRPKIKILAVNNLTKEVHAKTPCSAAPRPRSRPPAAAPSPKACRFSSLRKDERSHNSVSPQLFYSFKMRICFGPILPLIMRHKINENMVWTDSQDYGTDEILSYHQNYNSSQNTQIHKRNYNSS